jgi:hypothetical protein
VEGLDVVFVFMSLMGGSARRLGTLTRAEVEVPITVPVNTLVTIHCWTR